MMWIDELRYNEGMKTLSRRARRIGAVLLALLFLGWHGLPVVEAAARHAAPPASRLSHEPPEGPSGVNLVPLARGFYIRTATFVSGSHEVEDGCITPGEHRLLRFDFLVHNIGDRDLVMGSLASRPDLFLFSRSHDHAHIRDFNEYRLVDVDGEQVSLGYKQTYCLFDNRRLSPWAARGVQFPLDDCNTMQGLSSGWADLYRGSLACQYVPITGVEDGEYALLATVNAQRVVREYRYADNTLCVGLKIEGNRVTEISHPVCRGEVAPQEPVDLPS